MLATSTMPVVLMLCTECLRSLCSPHGCVLQRPCIYLATLVVILTRQPSGIWLKTGQLVLHDLTRAETHRMAALMAQYQDTPMDLADASLVTVAESLSIRRVFTVDTDFYIYRLVDGSALEVVR